MKTQLSKPARSHARYTEEYKKETLELWRASGRSACRQVLAQHGLVPSMSLKANCYDNVFIESFGALSNTNSSIIILLQLAPPSSITSRPFTTAPDCTPVLPIKVRSILNLN
jgi:transposase InsO family protein